MFNKIFIVPKINETNLELIGIVCKAIRTAAENTNVITAQVFTNEEVDSETLIIAVGGDGTMLSAMRIAAEKGAIATGINLGNVGFLTDIGFDRNDSFARVKLTNDLIEIFEDPESYTIENRMSLTATRNQNGDFFCENHMFNEFVISNTYSDEIINYHLSIDGVDAGNHRANAIIIGTPTGSTAYTLSNGGALLYPSMNVIQIVPVAPLSLTSRPIIVPGSSTITIDVTTDKTLTLRGDGQRLRVFPDQEPVTLGFIKYPLDTRILHPKGWNFFDMLTNKLGWKKL